MKITKLGHCCMLIEEAGVRILTDPGSYTIEEQKGIKNIDVVLITHEHADHFHIESLKLILSNNPNAKIFTNQDVAKILEKEGVSFSLFLHGQIEKINNLIIEGFGEKHAEMYQDLMRVDNTGYFIANKFFYPGDSLTNPGKPVKILALPVAGPWLKLSEAIDYALELAPEKCFPVHDGILKNIGSTDRLPPQVLKPAGIDFISLELDKEYDF